MADLTLRVGQTVQAQDGRHGVVRYIGPLHIAAGEWLGLELPDDSGKNDGSVKGERYFQCRPGYGIFVRKESVVKIVKQPMVAAKVNGSSSTTLMNGAATQPRSSSGMSADVARKRQSLMGSGSGSAPGSRLSIRSPTKSPTKAVNSSASSATSTPRTGTPATTARTSDSSTKSRLSITSRTSMPPPSTATTKGVGHSSRPSIGGGLNKSTATTKTTAPASRQSMAGSRLSLQPRVSTKQEKVVIKAPENEAITKSPTIDEAEEGDLNNIQEPATDSGDVNAITQSPSHEEEPPISHDTSRPPNSSTSRSITSASVESRTAQKRELEQYKATIRTLEKKLLDNCDRLKTIDALQGENGRYEGIIQALQKKLKANQQEISELRSKCEEAEGRANQDQGRSAEHESEIELATLDKEMAEERAEMFHTELEALKSKHEELELEADILREENRELVSVMSPEDKASAGWIQMEREQERLRQALIMLRDVSQQNDNDMKSEIKELQESLDEAERTASKYEEIAEKLSRSEQTTKHLREQLEAVETNDEIVEAMEVQREQGLNMIEQLRKQIQDLEEHIQVTDELESFHVEEEKRLHYQLDESEAILNEKQRQSIEQQRAIEDLEYTLTKFRDVVQGLQGDIDELRRSRDISEHEAHEMSSKSRAMMDLNLQLQHSAAKTQLKAIDVEMGKMHADQSSLHLEIVQNFVPETMESERNPIMALLCFKRIKAKAFLTKNLLSERMRDRPHMVQDDPFVVFEVMEKMYLIASHCDRFEQFLMCCFPSDFSRYSSAPYELEPVERAVSGWIDALRRDDLGTDGPQHLQRMIGILADMTEKLIPETLETKATELIIQSSTIENFADSIAIQLSAMLKEVQMRLGRPKEEDDESLVLDKKFDQFSIKARTVKYLCGRVTKMLTDLRSGSICLSETTWPFFEDTVQSTEQLARLIRKLGVTVFEEMTKLERDQPLSVSTITDVMTRTIQGALRESDAKANVPDDVFFALGGYLQTLQGNVDELNNKVSDVSSATEFETQPAPWTVRAIEIKAQKIISQDVADELARLNSQSHEHGLRLGERDKQIEEQQIKIQLLESRAKETKMKDENVKLMKDEVERLVHEKESAMTELDKLRLEFDTLRQSQETEQTDRESKKRVSLQDGVPVVLGSFDETSILQLRSELDIMATEITTLQAAIRHLKLENRSLRIPPNEAALSASYNDWLDPAQLTRPRITNRSSQQLQKESQDIFTGLIELAKTTKPVILKPRTTSDHNAKVTSSWRPAKETTRYQVLRQREEWEQWTDWKDDLVKRANLVRRDLGYIRVGDDAARSFGVGGRKMIPFDLSSMEYGSKPEYEISQAGNGVQIVDHST